MILTEAGVGRRAGSQREGDSEVKKGKKEADGNKRGKVFEDREGFSSRQ